MIRAGVAVITSRRGVRDQAMTVEPFVAIVSVGPDIRDVWSALELLPALTRHEPAMAWCVVCEDAPQTRGLSEVPALKTVRRAITIARPRSSGTDQWLSGLFEALRWIHENTDATFVFKVDTDALVIGSFARSIREFLASRQEAGLVGTLGVSCNPNVRAIRAQWTAPRLLKAYQVLPPALEEVKADEAPVDVDQVGRVSVGKRKLFDRIRPHVKTAIANGYVGRQFCEPGAFVITRSMLDRMARAGYLAYESVWSELPFPEHHVLEMYAFAVGLRTCDCSDRGQPFGLQLRGLPFPPEELLERGHSVIHSVKNDVRFTEDEIRQFFRERESVRQVRLSSDARRGARS